MIVLTDGMENASRKYTHKSQIDDMITKQREEKGWKYLYLSCDIDTFAQGDSIGISNVHTGIGTNNVAVGSRDNLSIAISGGKMNHFISYLAGAKGTAGSAGPAGEGLTSFSDFEVIEAVDVKATSM